jgi:hypothetical protein
MNIKELELKLIYNDIDEIRSVILALTNHEISGYLALLLFPTICFVIEETHNYLLSRNIKNDSSNLFIRYKSVIKKSRVLIKIFNDSDGGQLGLIKTLNLFQEKSTLLMNVGKTGCKGYLSRLLQPDIGIYFFEEDPIFMTPISFSVMGISRDEVNLLVESDFEKLPQDTKSFGYAIGQYLSEIEDFMILSGISKGKFSTTTLPAKLNITHDDFYSKKLYRKIAIRAKLTDKNKAAVLLFLLTQVNTAYALLPRILQPDSNLLCRIQFLTAYHAISSLFEISDKIDREFMELISRGNLITSIPNIKMARNIFAHYCLGEGKRFVNKNADVLDAVINGITGFSKNDIDHISTKQLEIINSWSRKNFPKSTLKNIGALFGDHT